MALEPRLPAERDWTDEVTESIDSVVGTIRRKTTVRATVFAREIVYGVVAGVLGAVVIFLLVVAGIRLLDSYLPVDPEGRRVWLVYAVGGAIFLVIGAFLWRRSGPQDI
jgi:hypothetical protein